MSDQNDVRIAKPCPKNWDEMTGDDQSRFCNHCEKSVHNLAEMSAADAEKLLCDSSGRVCIRMVSGPQGSFKTKQGWFRRMAMAGAATLTLIPMTACAPQESQVVGEAPMPEQTQPKPDVKSNATIGIAAEPVPVMGDMAPPQNPELGEVPVNEPIMGRAANPQPSMGSVAGPIEETP